MAVRTWRLLSAALGHLIIEAEITFLFCLCKKKKKEEIPVMNIDFVLLLLRQFYVTVACCGFKIGQGLTVNIITASCVYLNCVQWRCAQVPCP